MDLIGRSLEDVIIEPVRSILIPGFDEVKQNVRKPVHWVEVFPVQVHLFSC